MADELDGTRAHLLQMMLNDALDSVQAIYGDEGLKKVVGHMATANRARESSVQIDEIEKLLTKGQ